jgi:hypothetical protein
MYHILGSVRVFWHFARYTPFWNDSVAFGLVYLVWPGLAWLGLDRHDWMNT